MRVRIPHFPPHKKEIIMGLSDEDQRWRREIEKYLPGIKFMSFAGAEATIKWVFEHVEIKNEEDKK